MIRDLILDGDMDDVLEAAQECCDAGRSYLEHFGELSEKMAGSLINVRDDLSMMLAVYEDGRRWRYAYPSVREELRRLEGLAASLLAGGASKEAFTSAPNHVR